MITKRVSASRLVNIEASEIAQQAQAAELLNKFAEQMSTERVAEFPTIVLGEETDQIHSNLEATGRADRLFVVESATYRPGQVYKTAWGGLVHVENVQHYEKVDQLPWYQQMSQAEIDSIANKATGGIDHVFFSKFG